MFGSAPVVVQILRNDIVESEHAVDAVVADLDGAVVAGAGNPHLTAYFRSSLKPVQAAVYLERGWQPADERHVAVACASHNAEPAHLDAVAEILSSAGLDESALRCPPAFPMDPAAAARSGSPRALFRDCSGKHAAFLAASVANGWPVDSYLSVDHPLQRAILEATGALGARVTAVGVDGCGAPTFAATLHDMAVAFGRGIAASPRVALAMRTHSFYVAGTGRFDTSVMTSVPGDLVTKQGAEGIVCFASVSAGRCGTLKSRDGQGRAIPPATLAVLAASGLVSPAQMEDLSAFAAPPVLGGGAPQGTMRVRRS